MPWLAAFFGLASIVALVVVQLSNNGGEPDTATLGLVAIGLILLFAVTSPYHASQALRRISQLKLGALELGLKEIKRAERVRPVPGEEDGVSATRNPDLGYPQIVSALQGRLRFVRLILGFEDEAREEDYRKIASLLRKQELLTQDEEAFVLDLLEGSGAELPEWDKATQEDFLDAAYAFSVRFGPKMWDRHVRNMLREDGWFIADYKQPPGHRPDFLACQGGRWALLAARVAGEGPSYMESAGPRLRNFQAARIQSRAIVIPDIREGSVGENYAWSKDRPDGVKVIKFGDLRNNPRLLFPDLAGAGAGTSG